ncbi:tetratricopeptide repeat protein [Actinomycetospora chiangmaiensis]|uniref:tetratricopeptide repeat protein n=1 Tax=Actinomycetospora chiangmaiensis TaxID=402650 RepID=UPI000381E10D|nr:tetratricopeptide repeat protein [Actinomycetospora chiangmaiensis]
MNGAGWLTPRRVVVVDGGIGRPSSTHVLAERTATAVATALRAASPALVTTDRVLPRDHAVDMTAAIVTGRTPPALTAALDAVRGADAVVAVAGPTALLAAFLGLVEDFRDVPVLVVGPVGGLRLPGAAVVVTPDELAEAVVRRDVGPTMPSVVSPAPPEEDLPDEGWTVALRHGERGEWSEAARLLGAVVEDDPSTTIPRILLVEALMSSAQWGPAAAHLRRLIADHPADAYAEFLLERCAAQLGSHSRVVVSSESSRSNQGPVRGSSKR